MHPILISPRTPSTPASFSPDRLAYCPLSPLLASSSSATMSFSESQEIPPASASSTGLSSRSRCQVCIPLLSSSPSCCPPPTHPPILCPRQDLVLACVPYDARLCRPRPPRPLRLWLALRRAALKIPPIATPGPNTLARVSYDPGLCLAARRACPIINTINTWASFSFRTHTMTSWTWTRTQYTRPSLPIPLSPVALDHIFISYYLTPMSLASICSHSVLLLSRISFPPVSFL